MAKEEKLRVNVLGWRKIKFTKDYFVSPEGEVGREFAPNCYKVLRGKKHSCGYYQQNLIMDNGKRVYKTVHALVAEAFLGPRPKNWVVNHKNGVKTDNRLENLEYVTRSENANHAVKMRLMKPKPAKGVETGVAKLNDNSARMILECQCLSNNQIADIFNIDPKTVREIKLGKAWKHVYRNGVQLQLF